MFGQITPTGVGVIEPPIGVFRLAASGRFAYVQSVANARSPTELSQRFWLDPAIRVLIADLGISTTAVLRRAQLPGDLFSRDQVMLEPASYYRFWEAINAEYPGRFLPTEIARSTTTDGFSVPLLACLRSPDLTSAAHRLVTYKPLVAPIDLTVATNARTGLTLTFDWSRLPPAPDVLVWTELLFAVAVARLATRTPAAPNRLAGPRVGSDEADEISRYAGVRASFGRTCAVRFDPRTAATPFVTANPTMLAALDPMLRAQLADLDRTATSAERVRVALLELLPSGRSSLTDVADHLATSDRTLQRRLAREATTFQSILAATRTQLARHYLHDQDLPEPQIAFLLGYADPTSFRRAFRRWTGSTPRQTRPRHADSGRTPAVR